MIAESDFVIIKAKLKELRIRYCNRPMADRYSALYLYDLESNVGSQMMFRNDTGELLFFCLFGLESVDIDDSSL